MTDVPALQPLAAFRAARYGCVRRRADALVERIHVLVTTGSTLSPAHLSVAPVHRRGWGLGQPLQPHPT